MTLLEEIKNLLPEKQRKLIILKNKNINLYNQVIENTAFLRENTNLSERLKFLELEFTELPRCKICNKEHQHFTDKKEISLYCSKKCYFLDKEVMKKRVSGIDQEVKKEKARNTLLKKYGVEYNSQREDIKKILRRSKLEKNNPQALEYLQNKEWLENEYQEKTSEEIAEFLGVYYGTVLDYLRKYNIEIKYYCNQSKDEREIGEYIKSLGIIPEITNRSILDGKELDIYIPSHNLAIEINGLYWHSYVDFKKENQEKLFNKTLACLNKNIKILHISDEKWRDKKEIVESIISNSLGKSEKIMGRKCEVREISKKDHDEFCQENHINGTASSSVRYGLFYEDILVQVMSFSRPRFNKNYDWELVRLCTLKFKNIVGGASKLFSQFKKTLKIEEKVICYSDRQYGEGEVFERMGLKFKGSTKIGYRYTDGNISYNRMEFQKHKLQNLKLYDETLSERENMLNNGYRLFFDCGNNIWSYENV